MCPWKIIFSLQVNYPREPRTKTNLLQRFSQRPFLDYCVIYKSIIVYRHEGLFLTKTRNFGPEEDYLDMYIINPTGPIFPKEGDFLKSYGPICRGLLKKYL